MPHPNEVVAGCFEAVYWLWQNLPLRVGTQLSSCFKDVCAESKKSVRDKEERQLSESLGTCSHAGALVLSTKASITQFVICVATTRFKHGTKRLLQ